MSRSSYCDDGGDYLELYRGNVGRSMASKLGQARLRELRDALRAMTDKRLAADVFAPASGEACALGVWAKRHVHDAETVARFEGDDDDTVRLLKPFRWPHLVVRDVVYENDRERYVYEKHLGPHKRAEAYNYRVDEWPLTRARPETDEERYTRVLAWVEEQIIEHPAGSH